VNYLLLARTLTYDDTAGRAVLGKLAPPWYKGAPIKRALLAKSCRYFIHGIYLPEKIPLLRSCHHGR